MSTGRLDPSLDVQTRLVHGGEDGENSTVPIYQANTVGDSYTRFGNPSVSAFEHKFAQLEGGLCTLATGAGMAAVSVTLLAMARSGEHILTHHTGFVGTDELFGLLPRWGIEVHRIDMRDRDALAHGLAAGPALVYFEVLSNPAMELLDAPAVIAMARDHGIPVVVDNTLLTPVFFRPLEHGATVVLHSASKFICGHGDALGGLISTRDGKLGATIEDLRRLMGAMISPWNAFLLTRSLPTLYARMTRHAANAFALARSLSAHPAIARVSYPGLDGSPEYELANRILDGCGGVFSVELVPGCDPDKVGSALKICRGYYSFGDVATLVRVHDRAANKLRIAAGLEDPADLIADVRQALDAAMG